MLGSIADVNADGHAARTTTHVADRSHRIVHANTGTGTMKKGDVFRGEQGRAAQGGFDQSVVCGQACGTVAACNSVVVTLDFVSNNYSTVRF